MTSNERVSVGRHRRRRRRRGKRKKRVFKANTVNEEDSERD